MKGDVKSKHFSLRRKWACERVAQVCRFEYGEGGRVAHSFWTSKEAQVRKT